MVAGSIAPAARLVSDQNLEFITIIQHRFENNSKK